MTFDDELPDREKAAIFYLKYEVKEALGKGISSIVRRCVEKASGKEYAVKIVEFNDPDIQESTLREVEIMRLIGGHPNIIEIYDTFISETFIFIVMELCPNGELFDYLTKVVRLSEKKTRALMQSILEAVNYLHKMNIVHRDLKPENILLDKNMNVKISDFGFAMKLKENEKLFDLCGTPGYLAPEVLACSMYENMEGYDKQVDMWACGVILFTLLSGSPPFWHRRQVIMLRMIMEGKYNFTSPEWEDISFEAKDLIIHLLTVNSKQRYTSDQALKSNFFYKLDPIDADQTMINDGKRTFDARRMFRVAIITAMCIHRLKNLKNRSQQIDPLQIMKNPYRYKPYRKIIDTAGNYII
jgi:phosphorylase kinase gamma subunit